MKRLEREHGRILSVETKFRGDALAEDALAGATTITVADAGDFDEDGGWLTINGQVVEYIEADDDEGVITLATGLTAAAEQGDAVHLWSEFYQEAVDYQEILVELDGEYDNPETVVAELADGLPELPEGDRGRAAESCTLLRVSDDEWEVVNVGGRPKRSAAMQAEANDAYTITAADVTAGTATMTLSHTPIDESVKGFWGTLPQEPTEYTVSGQTVTWPLDGVAAEGDRLWCHYWYRVEGVAPSATILDWGSPGFKYLQTTLDDTADYSATAFDDSAWATGSAAFGDAATSRSDWNVPSTHWDLATALWVRRTVETGMLATATISLRLDNEAEVWWNGTSLGVFGTTTSSEATVDVPSALLTGTSVVIAVRATDDAVNNTGDRSHFDIRIDGETT